MSWGHSLAENAYLEFPGFRIPFLERCKPYGTMAQGYNRSF